MDNFEIKKVLDSMMILVDTREQDTERARERLNRFPCPYVRAKLDYGDYSADIKINEIWALQNVTSIFPCVAIERKMNLDELAQCFTKDRKRFEAEMERAKEHNARTYLLVENATWEHIINHKYRSRFTPNAFLASILAWQARYDLDVIFCKEETTSTMIYNILYRELKERLENGYFKAMGVI